MQPVADVYEIEIGGGEIMDKEKRIQEIDGKISGLSKDSQYASNLQEKMEINNKLVTLVKEWERLTGQKRPGAQNLVGYN